jgi:hypothetical protein
LQQCIHYDIISAAGSSIRTIVGNNNHLLTPRLRPSRRRRLLLLAMVALDIVIE